MTPAPLVILDEIDSTNAEARRLAEAGEAGPRWIVARRQTASRGRRGRKWETEQGNLAATLLITTPKSAAEAAQATFIAALAVADLLDVFVSPALVTIASSCSAVIPLPPIFDSSAANCSWLIPITPSSAAMGMIHFEKFMQ